MPVALYMDVHVPGPITQQLRIQQIDVLTAQEDGYDYDPDEKLLVRSAELGRVIFTQDVRFRVLAEDWQRLGKEFAGLLFGPQMGATIGQYVEDLKLVGLASEPHEWKNVVQFLPFSRRS